MAETSFDNQFEEIIDNSDVKRIKCKSCGSNMVFDPNTQTLLCEHCGSNIDFVKNVIAEEIDINNAFSASAKWSQEEAVVFYCENCGAKVVLQKTETAKACPFCGTAHVKQSSELAGLKPNALIPFTFDSSKALEYSKAWARKRFFAPTDFKKKLNADNIHGVYTPCFTFDSSTVSAYSGRIGTTHTRTVGSGKNRRVETYVVWRSIGGTYNSNYDDVLITAGSKFSQKELDKISPYRTNDSTAYEENYLLGFMAYHYDNEISDCWDSAKRIMDNSIRRGILSQYTYDRLSYLNVSTNHYNVTYKYVMLPVYVGNFKYRKKTYNFYVNGSTGRVNGKTPKSLWKILGTILGACAVIGGIALLIACL